MCSKWVNSWRAYFRKEGAVLWTDARRSRWEYRWAIRERGGATSTLSPLTRVGLVRVNKPRLFSVMSQANTQQSYTGDYQQSMEYAPLPKPEMLYLCAGQRLAAGRNFFNATEMKSRRLRFRERNQAS